MADAAEHSSEGPLSGLVVLDLSANLASAYTTLLFADFGADVIQVERPGGSSLRQEVSWPFWFRGKRSVVLDLKTPADRDIARRLAAGSDVVVEAFGARHAERLGLGYSELAGTNPRLVYTSITGFGHDGAFSHLKAYEAIVQAKSGSMYGNIAPGRPGEPVMSGPYGATLAAALLAIQGSLIALHERQSSGLGQRVDATMIQGLLAQDSYNYFAKMLAERYPEAFTSVGVPSAGRRVPTYWLLFGLLNGYSKDGRWMQFAHATPRQFEAFVRALGLGWTRSDPEWSDAPDSEDEGKRDRWWTMMLEAVRSKTIAEWQDVFDADEDVFAEVYRDGLEVFEHPQIVHDGHSIEIEDPELGTVKQMGVLVKMSETAGCPTRPAPRLDEHGRQLRDAPAPPPQAVPRPTAPASRPPDDRPALRDVTIIDLGSFFAGPFGSAMLADQGATVIKIESLDGDPIRVALPVPEAGGVRVTQGKKSVAVNVFTDEGREIALELIRRADIVLHTYRQGVARRMGLDPDSAHAVNPQLIYHHGVGYGVDGPYARRPAYAPTIGAPSGFARRAGGGGPEGAPLSIDEIKDISLRVGGAPPANPDAMSALAVSVGMMLGLYARDRGAGGQVTLTSMLSTMGHVLSDVLVGYSGAAAPAVLDPDYYGYSALYRLYRARDGWVVLCASDQRAWAALVAALADHADLGADGRFTTAEDRMTHDGALVEALTAIFASGAAAEWERDLSAAGVGCAEVVPPLGGLGMGLFEEGQACQQLGMLTTVDHPIFDKHVRSAELVRLSRSRPDIGPGCTIGQHTVEVLRDMLGYDAERIADLQHRGIIAV